MVYRMARPRSSNPKTRPVTVKMSESEVAALDQRRGSTSRSTYLRLLFVKAERPSMGHPHPEPHPDPIPITPDPAPVPNPITPPVPPPNPVETFTPPIPDPSPRTERHLHRFVKVKGQEPVSYHQGTPLYRQRCECGQTKVG